MNKKVKKTNINETQKISKKFRKNENLYIFSFGNYIVIVVSSLD